LSALLHKLIIPELTHLSPPSLLFTNNFNGSTPRSWSSLSSFGMLFASLLALLNQKKISSTFYKKQKIKIVTCMRTGLQGISLSSGRLSKRFILWISRVAYWKALFQQSGPE